MSRLEGSPGRYVQTQTYTSCPALMPITDRFSATFLTLPTELHYEIFKWLDPLDSTCLGLTARSFYTIHWHLYGAVPLSYRRNGSNGSEHVWKHISFLFQPSNGFCLEYSGMLSGIDLADINHPYCRHCGLYRCELYRHLQHWMEVQYTPVEYCRVTERFGPVPSSPTSEDCYRCNPRNSLQCGRHYSRFLKRPKIDY